MTLDPPLAEMMYQALGIFVLHILYSVLCVSSIFGFKSFFEDKTVCIKSGQQYVKYFCTVNMPLECVACTGDRLRLAEQHPSGPSLYFRTVADFP